MIQHLETLNRVLFAALFLLHAATWHWGTGRSQTRGSTFFGARVEAGFAESDAGRAIMRTFHGRLWSSAFVLAAGSALSGPYSIWPNAALFVSLAASVAFFALAHRRTRQQAAATPAPAQRVASLANEPESRWLTAIDWLVMIVPVTVPIATLFFVAHYGRGYSEQFLFQHYSSAVFALSFGLMCSANQFALRYRSRPSDWAPDPGASHKYRTCLGVMFATVFTFGIVQICALTLSGFRHTVPWLRHWDMSTYFAVTFAMLALWHFGLWRLRRWLSRHLATESLDPMPDTCWKWGSFYFNRQDPALVVPTRSGIGYSPNYARPSVWVVTVLISALSIAFLVQSFEWLSAPASPPPDPRQSGH
jgi:uncharacterized membrane protein